MTEDKERDTLIVMDGSNLIYRAFHALPDTLTNSEGLHTNAIYGFTQTLKKLLDTYSPRYVAVAFDMAGPTFRHEIHEEYKAERPPMPDLLSEQIPYIKRMVEAFNIRVLEKQSFEADDIMATIASRINALRDSGATEVRVAIVTGDKDMYQLVDDDTVIVDPRSGDEYTPDRTGEKFGVPPGSIRDLLSLAGDASDNIPGVPGIGMKTAVKLLNKFGSIEGIYEHIDDVPGKKIKENLVEFREQAMLSRELATLHTEVPIEWDLESLEFSGPDMDTLEPLLMELGFRKILEDVRLRFKSSVQSETPRGDYTLVQTEEALAAAAEELKDTGAFAITLSMTGEGYSAALDCLSLSNGPDKAFYIPLDGAFTGGMEWGVVAAGLKSLLENPQIKKNTDNSKVLYIHFARLGVRLAGLGIDTALASYLLNPSKQDHTITALAYEYLGALGREEGEEGTDKEREGKFLCENAILISELSGVLEKKLEEQELHGLYTGIELPLSEILAEMERHGIRVDGARLKELSVELKIRLDEIEKAIYAAAGTEFNINSPKQLSNVLFTILGLKPVKKTKTGFSTNEEVLTRLASQHELPAQIMEFRQLAKLKSTYVDAIVELIDPATGRVHTSFNQTVTATGRLSSSRPNMQNIPVRGETASRIREAVVPGDGMLFLSADYSQIELRLAAHMSGDPVLIESFSTGEDVHTRTASEVFGVMPGLVTKELRRRAKAINFGILYGMGSYGLSTELGIPVKDALEYIESYFEHYKLVKEFIDRTVDEARKQGYTETLFGRRRFVPELQSGVEATRRFGERIAVNTPLQGTAADMIKVAMVRIHERLAKIGGPTRMLLQIHDELLFEVSPDDLDEISELVKTEMEGVVSLVVPVEVNLKSGINWNALD